MKTRLFILGICTVSFLGVSCRQSAETEHKVFATPLVESRFDRSKPLEVVEVAQAIQAPQSLKLSQIASSIEYYTVGTGNYTVKQVISLPKDSAFITFNYPRIYYRKQNNPSKRYGFKALDYKWNKEMNGLNLFYDKKTTRMFVALSGKTKVTRKEGLDSHPCIGELSPLDSMLTIYRYVFPENLPVQYVINAEENQLIGFSSTGYTLGHYLPGSGEPDGVMTFNLQGDLLCKFQLKEGQMADTAITKQIPSFKTFYWNTEQDKMTFMIPYCDTIYQLCDSQTIAPRYVLDFGDNRIDLSQVQEGLPKGKIWVKSLFENPQGLFVGIFQKASPIVKNWFPNPIDYKPTLTHQIVYLKKEGRTISIPYEKEEGIQGFINDLDGGLPFWPDGQTDDCLYMIRSVTEMRKLVKRTGSLKQQKLLQFLDNSNVKERDFVMIVVR